VGIYIKQIHLLRNRSELKALPDRKLVINTINAHSYNLAQKDAMFAKALTNSDVLIPDGASIVIAIKWLRKKRVERIAGWDLFTFEMEKLNRKGGICFFLGSSVKVLEMIMKKTSKDYTNIRMIGYSPRYRSDFTNEENKEMIDEIHAANPDLILIGMTAPKQEKWIFLHRNLLKVNCHICAIGAVFDFYAGTVRRAPVWFQEHSLEWLFRLIMEPRRMWKRYIIGNFLFVYYIFKEKYFFQQPLPEQFQSESDTRSLNERHQRGNSLFNTSKRTHSRNRTGRRYRYIPKRIEIFAKQTITTKEDQPHTPKKPYKKQGISKLLIILIAMVASVGGFFLYPVIHPMIHQTRVLDNTVIEDANPEKADETKEDILNNSVLQASNETTDDKNIMTSEIKSSTTEIKSPSEAVNQPQRTMGQGKYVLIVGSFNSQPEAERYVKKLQAAGIFCEIINIGNKVFRISIADFDEKNDAESYAKQIKSRPYCENVWVARR